MKTPTHEDGSPMVLSMGYFWPNGGQEYGERYVRHARDMDQALNLCRDSRTAFQAGGHVGIWPIYLADVFDAVLTVEPEIDNFRALQANLQRHNTENVKAFHAALGAEAGKAKIKHNARNIGGHKISEKGDQEVRVVTIDSYTADLIVNLIVLDVEGYEPAALLGARATIEKHRPVIMLEDRDHARRHPGMGGIDEIKAFLAGFGYVEAKRVAKDVIFTCAQK